MALWVQFMALASARMARKMYFRIPSGSSSVTYKLRHDYSKFTINMSPKDQEKKKNFNLKKEIQFTYNITIV